MKKPNIATTKKPAPNAKIGTPVATGVTGAKPKKPGPAQKPDNKPEAVTPKPVPKAKVGRAVAAAATGAKANRSSPAQKPPNKPKTVTPKPGPKAKAGQPVASVAATTKPKTASATRKAPKKAKAVASKTVVPTTKKARPERVGLPAGNIWPNWVENLLGSFGVRKK